jgi:hypothetical protein
MFDSFEDQTHIKLFFLLDNTDSLGRFFHSLHEFGEIFISAVADIFCNVAKSAYYLQDFIIFHVFTSSDF